MGIIKDTIKKNTVKEYSSKPEDMAVLAEQYAKKDLHTVTEVLKLISSELSEATILNLIKEVKYNSIKNSRKKHNTDTIETQADFIKRMENN